jgi:hypothetical protein
MTKRATLTISQETKQDLTELKNALEKVAGKKFTYDDVVNFLFDYFLTCNPDNGNCRDVLNILHAKKEMTLIVNTELKREEIARNFFYVPDDIVNRLTEISKKKKTSAVDAFLTALKIGTDAQEKFFVMLDEKESDEVHEKIKTLPLNAREKLYSLMKKKLKAVFDTSFREVKKKL